MRSRGVGVEPGSEVGIAVRGLGWMGGTRVDESIRCAVLLRTLERLIAHTTLALQIRIECPRYPGHLRTHVNTMGTVRSHVRSGLGHRR